MTIDGWRYAAASVIGSSHVRSNSPCQDANLCMLVTGAEGSRTLVAVACDGAGSASCAEEGAQLACAAFCGLAVDFISGGNRIAQVNREVATVWVDNIRAQIERRAQDAGKTTRDYACTLVAAVVGDERAAFMQVGDGAIVVSADEVDTYGHVFWPERGEYANTTYFLTGSDALEQLQFESVDRAIMEIALFTDGIQTLALDYKAGVAFDPFFRGLFPALRVGCYGRVDNLCEALVEFLSSSRVNAKTDDDKTLILASRVPPSGQRQIENESSAELC